MNDLVLVIIITVWTVVAIQLIWKWAQPLKHLRNWLRGDIGYIGEAGATGPQGPQGATGPAGVCFCDCCVRDNPAPVKTFAEGDPCPIHGRVHDSHGWYVCVPEDYS